MASRDILISRVLILLIAIINLDKSATAFSVDTRKNDNKQTTPEIIAERGYPVEIHTVTSSDGYISELHRTYSPKSPLSSTEKPAVIVRHGNFQTSIDWVIVSTEKSLAFILADNGYDVWLSNARGNFYSNKHVNLTTKDKIYWDFSFYEMGTYDMTSQIDYVSTFTGQEKIFLIAYSLGTTTTFMALANSPEYNEKLRLGIFMAPVAYQHHTLSLNMWSLAAVQNILSLFEPAPLPNDGMITLANKYGPLFCENDFFGMCKLAVYFGLGYNPDQLNSTQLPLILGHIPAASSLKSWVHVFQLMRDRRFQLYDYGQRKNLQIYGSRIPPEVPISNIKAPVSLIFSRNDIIAAVKDVQILANQLPNMVDYYEVSEKKFNHGDFTYGVDAKELVYDHVLELLSQY